MTKLEKIKDFCFTPKDMQLKAIKHYPSMSQETYCYEANLYILDVKICRVHNVGRGGSDDFDLEDPNLLGAGFLTWEYIQKLDEWCKRNLPKWYFEYRKEYVSKSLEVWLSEQVTEYVNWKEFNKLDKLQRVNTLAMIAPVNNEEKQKLLESVSLEEKVENLLNIIKFYLHDVNNENQTIQ